MKINKTQFESLKIYFQNISNATSKFLSKKAKFYKIWIILMNISIIYNHWLYPFIFCVFNEKYPYQEVVIDGINIIDIFIDVLIKNDNREYFLFYLIELFACCPFFIFLSINDESIFVNYYVLIKFLGLLRLIKAFILMGRYGEGYHQFLNFLIYKRKIKEGFLAFYELILAIHIATCLNFLFFEFDSHHNEKGWVIQTGLRDASIVELYFQNSYYIFTMVITQGYGNITPKTNWEMATAIFYMFFGNTFFIRFAGRIIKLTQQNFIKQLRKEKKEFYLEFARNFFFPKKYFTQALTGLFAAEISAFDLKNVDVIKNDFSELSDELFKDLVFHLHYELYRNFDLFSTAPPSFFKKVYNHFQFDAFEKGDIIYRAGYPAEHIFFLLQGSIILKYKPKLKKQHEKVFLIVGKDSFFGESEYLKKKERKFTAKARCKSLLFKINCRTFFKILEEYPFLKNKFLAHSYHKAKRQKRLKIIYAKNNVSPSIPSRAKKRWQNLKKAVFSLRFFVEKNNKKPKRRKKLFKLKKIQSRKTSLARSKSILSKNFDATFHKTRFTTKVGRTPIFLNEIENLASIRLEKLMNQINIDLFRSIHHNLKQPLESDTREREKITNLDQQLKVLEEKIEFLNSVEKNFGKN